MLKSDRARFSWKIHVKKAKKRVQYFRYFEKFCRISFVKTMQNEPGHLVYLYTCVSQWVQLLFHQAVWISILTVSMD